MRKKRRGYFKHFNTATAGDSIQSALYHGDLIAPLLFWFICEKCNQEASDRIMVEMSELCRIFHMRRDKMQRANEALTRHFPSIVFTFSGEICEFFNGNYAESQETRGQKRAKRGPNNGAMTNDKIKLKEKDRRKPGVLDPAKSVLDSVINSMQQNSGGESGQS